VLHSFGPTASKNSLKGIGLFVDRALVRDSRIFGSVPWDDICNFVFITQSLTRVEDFWGGVFPLDRVELEETGLI
jgi:hypothetical protein